MVFTKVRGVFVCAVVSFLLGPVSFVIAQETPSASYDIGTINVTSESSSNRIGPGDFLPISVKLVNFGSIKRVDVTIDYKILDLNNKEIYSENETVAVETTASFVKRIQIPYTIGSGTYTLVSILKYPYQEDPAISKFPFIVERKIAGFFESDLVLFSIITIVAGLLVLYFIYFIISRNQKSRVVFHDYNNKPKEQVIYYEILSDIISQMRLRIGNDAIEIAKDIPDLEINDKNGLVVNIKKNPAKIIALLVSRYEKISGHKISFGLRKKL